MASVIAKQMYQIWTDSNILFVWLGGNHRVKFDPIVIDDLTRSSTSTVDRLCTIRNSHVLYKRLHDNVETKTDPTIA